MDLKYLQNFRFGKRRAAQIDVDIFNLFNSQTGYNIEPRVHAAGYGTPQSFFDPRRIQMRVQVPSFSALSASGLPAPRFRLSQPGAGAGSWELAAI